MIFAVTGMAGSGMTALSERDRHDRTEASDGCATSCRVGKLGPIIAQDLVGAQCLQDAHRQGMQSSG